MSTFDVIIEGYFFNADDEGDLESTLVEYALTSLPGMVGKVVDKHKDHTDEVGKKQETLNSLMVGF